MKPYVKFGVLTALIVGSLVWLAMGGVKETQTYYKTIPELQKMGSSAQGQRLRVGGDVEPATTILPSGCSAIDFISSRPLPNVTIFAVPPLPKVVSSEPSVLYRWICRPPSTSSLPSGCSARAVAAAVEAKSLPCEPNVGSSPLTAY